MKQHVIDSTHTTVWVESMIIMQSEIKVTDTTVAEVDFLDHSLVTCYLPVRTSDVDSMSAGGHKWKGFSINSYKSDLLKSILYCDLGE